MFGGFATNVKTTGYELTGDLGKCLRMGGLTFYKDFTKSGNLDADFALGSRTATYTSTSGVPTIGANGYATTTANDDVLKYAISGNRTAAQESIVIKFMPSSNFANDGVVRVVTTTDSKSRVHQKTATSTVGSFRPNEVDFNAVVAAGTTNVLQNTSYIDALVCQSTSPNARLYRNGTLEGTSTTNTWDGTIAWGNYFYIGSQNDGTLQLNGSIAWIKIFNRALTAAEIATLQ